MQDLEKTMDGNGLFVYTVKNGDLGTVDGFEEAIKVSLFSDARRDESQIKSPIARGGWVGNLLNDDRNRELGGLVYLLDKSRLTLDVIAKSRQYCYQSLKWMIEDRICRDIIIDVKSEKQQRLIINIQFVGRDGAEFDYTYTWDKTNAFTNSQNIKP